LGTLESAADTEAAELRLSSGRYGEILRDLGLPLPLAEEEPAPIPRSIQAICDCIRRGLDLDWTAFEPLAAGDRQFLVPLDPEELSTAIAQLAVGIAAAALADAPGVEGHAKALQELQALLDQLRPDIQMRAVERECRRRGVPWRLLPWSGRITQIGEGSRQIRLDLTETSETRLHASRAASDKVTSNLLLARHGLPVPRQVSIERSSEAWAAATRLGPPVVVKPRSGRKGKAVSTGLRQRAEVEKAAHAALLADPRVVVEKHIAGLDHRILVAFGQVVAVSQRRPAHVVGDGLHSVADLVQIENRNPARSPGRRTMLSPIVVDADAVRLLAAQNLELQSVPPAGAMIVLKSSANRSTGGTSVDMTSRIHPDNARMAVRAAEIIGLDVAGIDFIAPDIAQSYKQAGGGICEINSRPAFRTHLSAEGGEPGGVINGFLDALLRRHPNWRVPVVLLYGTGPAGRARELAELLRGEHGLRIGIAGRDGLAVDGFALPARPKSLHDAHMLLTEDPTVDIVVMEADAHLMADGLGLSHADVALTVQDSGPEDSASFLEHIAIMERAGAVIVPSEEPAAALRALARASLLTR
jgi:cyanophycin synthetase